MATIQAYHLGKSDNDFFIYAFVNLRKISKYFDFPFFCHNLGYYQPHVAYPQFYQTHPAVFARPIMGRPIESHQRNICKNNNGQVVPCYKIDQSGIKPVINLFKSMREKWYFVTIIVLTYCEKKLF